jgi:predicted alpha/beta-fold hydrolase
MWEGLARTERQDRVLHGGAKLVNVLLGIVLLPLWLFGQLIGGRVRDFLSALERRGRRALPVPPERERTMEALMRDLHAIPQHLRHSDFAEARRGFADISNFVLAQHREGAVLGYRYPGQFRDHIIPGADGERIAASIALQEAARPGLIVVHGLFTNSRFDYVRQIAVRAFYEWGFNVAALDLRSFGMTELTTPAPSTAGWKEGLDILALARYLKELGATSVGALGISLGGSAVVNACDYDEAAMVLDGGILAVSPPAVPKLAWERLSEPVPRGHPRYALHRALEAALISRVRSGRWPPEAENMLRAMEVVSAPYYQLEADQIWTSSRGLDRVPDSKVPLLVLHPEDDPIVKVEHARMLAEAAKDNDLVRVWILPSGSHGLLEAADPRWTHAVYRTFFERWATYAERTVGRPTGEGPELVYSSQEPG